MHRRYRVDHLHLNRRRLNGDWFTETMFSKVVSIQGKTCAQVFTNGNSTTVHPLDSKSKVAQALTEFADDVGIPDSLLSDGAPEVIGPKTDFMKEVNRLKIRLKRSEACRPRSRCRSYHACWEGKWDDKSCRIIHESIDCRSTLQLVSAHYVLINALGYWSSVWAGPFTPWNGCDPWVHRFQVAEEAVKLFACTVHNLRGPFKYGYYEGVWCYVGFGMFYSVGRCQPVSPNARNHSFISYFLPTCPFYSSSRLLEAHNTSSQMGPNDTS